MPKENKEKKKLTKLQIAELKGAGKVLDDLWTGCMNFSAKENADRIEGFMIYYFGEDWTTTMYEVINDGKGASNHQEIKPYV